MAVVAATAATGATHATHCGRRLSGRQSRDHAIAAGRGTGASTMPRAARSMA
ncbi:MAG: hypothetical protein R2752_13850 [Vicinamibacterales bacterium]